MKTLFRIDHLSCSYNESGPVLVADNISIPKGKITVLLGPSGAGKSTLLEALGLMSETIDTDVSKVYFSPDDTSEYDLVELWRDNKEDRRYEIRKLYYSFIFQSTNLMPNFSALENVGLTELIQNKPESEAYFNAIETLVQDLSVSSLSYEKKPFEYSGGERQRLAFARAINPDFSVLFGDEPTGNLDHFNSQKLMKFISEFIDNHEKDVSAIIVSHDIPLTLDFADNIIVLAKRGDGVSTIEPKFIYSKDEYQWDKSEERKAKLQNEIELLLNSDTESYGRILMQMAEHGVSDIDFEEMKEKLTAWTIKIEDRSKVTVTEQKAFEAWLTDKLTELNVPCDGLQEFIQLFSRGEVRKADIKINEVVRTIQDLKMQTAVEERKGKKSVDSIVETEFRTDRSFAFYFFGFFSWLFLSIPQFIGSVLKFSSSTFNSFWSKRLKNVLRNRKRELGKEDVQDQKKRKDPIQSAFYYLCVAWDWLSVAIGLSLKKRINPSYNFSTIPHDFKHLFFRNEAKVLLGKKNKNYWLIVSILFFTMLSIGFSNGSLNYLQEKMEDPFVRSVNATIPSSRQKYFKAKREIAKLNCDSLQERYKFDTIIGYNSRTIYFRGDLPMSVRKSADGRSIPFDDPLVNTIINPMLNGTVGNAFISADDYSIIVTRSFIERLRCSDNPAYIFRESNDRLIPIPIRAIVDKLPGERVDFVTTQFFFDNLNQLQSKFLFKDNKKFYGILRADSTKVDQFHDAVTSFVDAYEMDGGMLEHSFIDVYLHENSWQELLVLQISFYDSEWIKMADIDEFFTELKASEMMSSFFEEEGIDSLGFIQSYYPNLVGSPMPQEFENITINFTDLTKVDQFAELFTTTSGVKLEMAKIEQMKNYNFVSKLTQIISIILIGFSVLMINIFMSSILRTHLSNIKMNIGTFKAFGIDIKRIYIGMMYVFVMLPLVAAFTVAIIFGYSGLVYYLIKVISPFAIEKALYFDLFNSYTLCSILILLVANYLSSLSIINEIFKKTPGDLIYDRSNKA